MMIRMRKMKNEVRREKMKMKKGEEEDGMWMGWWWSVDKIRVGL